MYGLHTDTQDSLQAKRKGNTHVNSAKELLHQIADPRLSNTEAAQLRCRLAKELEEAGNFEAAREALGELWQRVGERPVLNGLDKETAADVLLRAAAN